METAISNKLDNKYTIIKKKNSPYDYIAKDLTHYLELKERRVSSTKYGDIVIDDIKMNQLIKLDKPTLLLSTYTDKKAFCAWLTINKNGEIILNPKLKTITKKAPANTDFGNRYNYIDKTFYSIDLEDCKQVI